MRGPILHSQVPTRNAARSRSAESAHSRAALLHYVYRLLHSENGKLQTIPLAPSRSKVVYLLLHRGHKALPVHLATYRIHSA